MHELVRCETRRLQSQEYRGRAAARVQSAPGGDGLLLC